MKIAGHHPPNHVDSVMFLSDVPMGETSSGAEQVLWQQAKGLACRGIAVSAISRSNDCHAERRDFLNGVDVAHYFAPVSHPAQFLMYTLNRSRKLFSEMNGEKAIDTIIAHQPFTCAAILAWFGPRIKRLIYVAHSPIRKEYLAGFAPGAATMVQHLYAVMRGWVESFCLLKADSIVTLSHYMKETFTDEHPFIKNKVVVIPGGVDLQRFRWEPDRYAAKLRLHLPTNRIHLLTVRNLDARMGLAHLIRAISKLKARFPKIYLTIGGSGPEHERLRRLVIELGLGNHVQLTGYIPEDLLPTHYAAADFFILPTQALEGFGLVTLESWASGTPVLGTPVGAIPEVLSTFNKKFLFLSTDSDAMAVGIERAILDEFRNEARYDQLRHDVRCHVEEHFSWEKHIASLAQLISDVRAR